MSLASKILKGSVLLTASEVVVNACVFIRNVILARVLSKDDFGIAATLGLTVSLFELGARMSFGQQIIRARDQEAVAFQNSAHTVQVLAGLISAALILILCHPLAVRYGIQQHTYAIALLALVPLTTGLGSLDFHRQMRKMNFLPNVVVEALPQVLMTIAVWPLTIWFKDYRAILILILAKAVFSLVASHIFAEERFKLSWDRSLIASSLKFGWPLLASSFLMFAIFQGDRLLVATYYTLSQLAAYTAASTLAMAPGMALFKISGSICLPLMAGAQDRPEQFCAYNRVYASGLAMLGAAIAVVVILGGQYWITLVFGAKYSDAAVLTMWLMIGQALRMVRGAPTCAALAKGDSVNGLVANFWRVVGLLISVPLALIGLPILWIAICSAIGEALALIASTCRLNIKHSVPAFDTFLPTLLVVALCALGLFAKYLLAGEPQTLTKHGITSILAGCLASGIFLALFPSLRHACFKFLTAFVSKIRSAAPRSTIPVNRPAN